MRKALIKPTQACTCTYMCVCVCVHQKYTCTMQHLTAIYKLLTFRSSACEREREQRKHRQLERERESETVWTTSMLTLHFCLIHHLKQKGH